MLFPLDGQADGGRAAVCTLPSCARPKLDNVVPSGWHLHQSLVDAADGRKPLSARDDGPLTPAGERLDRRASGTRGRELPADHADGEWYKR